MTRNFNPAKVVLISFSGAILLGATLLSLPAASVSSPVSFLDALFMATSAVCVTGLSVLDIGTQLTFFGQLVILGLIQIGGLGIMTFSVFFMMLLKQSISFTSQWSVGFQPHQRDARNFLNVLIWVFVTVVFFEGVGAACLFSRLRLMHDTGFALYSSIFHAVSAFCNAGFSLYKDSLIRFQKELFVPIVIMVLIVVGGLGFMLIDEVRLWLKAVLRRESFRVSLNMKICFIGTLILILGGALVIWFLEKDNLLDYMTPLEQTVNAFFLSITSRTAGFNTLETPSLTNATLFAVIFLMFIGGCAGSTAGGVKVSTIVVLVALLTAHRKGRKSAAIMGRKIPNDTVARSLAIFTGSFIIVNVATFLFQMTETIGVSHAVTRGSFLDLLFEATSAFATVGLSTGVTTTLSATGKLITVALMLTGRVGPLTLGYALLSGKREPVFEYVEEDVAVG